METFERKETKYLLTPAQHKKFLSLVAANLAPAEYPEGDVVSLYYDTPDDLLINRSLAGPKYKEKLRIRSYGAAEPESAVYIEIKKKLKGIVYKRRVSCSLAAARAFLGGMDYQDAISRWPLQAAEAREESHSWKSLQVAGEIAWMRDHYEGLAPKMLVSTHRTSFVGADDAALRITIDADVRWDSSYIPCGLGKGGRIAPEHQPGNPLDADGGKPSLGQPLVGRNLFDQGERILEVKCADAYPLWLVDALNACGIRPQSVSKYGRAYQAAMALYREQLGCASVVAKAAATWQAGSVAPARVPAPAYAGEQRMRRFRFPRLRPRRGRRPRHAVA